MSIYVPDEQPGDSLGWSKWYGVFSISRLYLRSIGFTTEQVNSLSDEDMQRIADTYNNRNFISFEEDIKFLVSLELAEKQSVSTTDLWNKAFHISGVTREDLVQAGFPKEFVEQIDDTTMQEIAAAMADVYCDNGYWEDLELCVNRTVILLQIEDTDNRTGGSV